MNNGKIDLHYYDLQREQEAVGPIQRWVESNVALEDIVDRLYDLGLTGIEMYRAFERVYDNNVKIAEDFAVAVWDFIRRWNKDICIDRYGRRH